MSDDAPIRIGSPEYDEQAEPILLSKPLLDRLLKDDSPADLIALYSFYYYTAKWQRTNQPKATTRYIATGLKWGLQKAKEVKSKLLNLGLIENVVNKDSSGKIVGHYIKVKFIWTTAKNQEYGLPSGGFFHPLGNPPVNALSSNREVEEEETPSPSPGIESEAKITPSMFEKFWSSYPNKTDKGAAKNKWNIICGKKNKKEIPTWPQVRRAIAEQSRTERWQEGYIPHPTTWLNQQRWLDDPKMMVNPRKQPTSVPTSIHPNDLLNKRYNGAGQLWISRCLEPALSITHVEKGQEYLIAAGIIKIEEWFTQQQRRPKFSEIPADNSPQRSTYNKWECIPDAFKLVQRYIRWMSNQNWLDDIGPNVYSPESRVFLRFLSQAQKDDGFNFITGVSL